MQNYETNNAPRLPRRPRFRNDARALLRSRTVQMVLVAGTLLQAGVMLERGGNEGRQAQVAAEPVRSIQVLPSPRQLSELRLSRMEAKPKPRDRADELADRYRSKGYRISDRLADQIHEAAVENGIDPALAFGLVRTESGFRNSATSHVGATGLTQLMPATARWLEPGTTRAELRDSETNLRIGFRYLRGLIRKYDGDTTLALLAYNRGPGTVDRLVRRGRNPDNGYADMVRRRN
jgi:soluble lytic murein transglycosylase-like protein